MPHTVASAFHTCLFLSLSPLGGFQNHHFLSGLSAWILGVYDLNANYNLTGKDSVLNTSGSKD